jgi:hypothetical protein
VKNQKNYGVVGFEKPWWRDNKTIIKYKFSEKGAGDFSRNSWAVRTLFPREGAEKTIITGNKLTIITIIQWGG